RGHRPPSELDGSPIGRFRQHVTEPDKQAAIAERHDERVLVSMSVHGLPLHGFASATQCGLGSRQKAPSVAARPGLSHAVMTIPGTEILVEGHAIVSSDGMIAAADGSMPPQLRNDTDWRIFQSALDQAALVVLGRIGHARHPNPGRRRLVLTHSVAELEADPQDGLSS